MRFDVLTLFPDMVERALDISVTGRALSEGHIQLGVHDIRSFSENKHRNVDDTPYGGGPGMVMTPGPIVRCLEEVRAHTGRMHTVMLSPGGRPFKQDIAEHYATLPGVTFICGRYEGIDERVTDWVDDLVSIGDYVLTGGELGALVIIDATTRLLPGVLGNDASSTDESWSEGLVEYPQYTRPRDFRGRTVPDVLLSGNHAAINAWRRTESLSRTRIRRPDRWSEQELSVDDKKLLET